MSLLNNARHWRNHADEARGIAGHMSNPEMKRIMLEVVACYERLAQLTEASEQSAAASRQVSTVVPKSPPRVRVVERFAEQMARQVQSRLH